jgi:hypothetical protein
MLKQTGEFKIEKGDQKESGRRSTRSKLEGGNQRRRQRRVPLEQANMLL